MPSILDPCCGSRMMWFDKQDQRCLFGDLRTESHYLKDRGNLRHLEIHPDVRLCETTTSCTGFADWLNDDVYPVTHWQHLPPCPQGSVFEE